MTQAQAPVRSAERIEFLDILRGFAVLGILAMNIQSFSMPGAAYFNPTAWGDLSGLNRIVWLLANTLANQKFMTIFSMLFGAGVMLMYERSQASGRPFGGLHYRRMFFLLLFGLAHAYLLWAGDILFSYALSGMLLFLFRKARPGWLLANGLIFLLVGSGLLLMSGFSAPYWPPEQLAELERDFRPSALVLDKELAAFRGSWLDGFHYRAPESLEMHLFVFPFYMLWRALGAMLIGMALFRWGFITGKASSGVYRLFLGLALLVGLPATILGGQRQLAGGWDPVRAFFIESQWGYWGSLLLALGWLSALLLLTRSGIWRGLMNRLAACGRMAFTNYILQTVLCCLIFYGYGLGLIGRVPRVGQAGIALAIWLFQLWLSPIWLARFRYGPLEWAWRSLSYGARQTMRRSG
jgi:uncharacterized protein